MPKTSAKNKIRSLFCKKCGTAIDECGLCDYSCEFDGATESERPEEQMEVRVYELTFIRTEPYKKETRPR
jgi:hypothetical protein